MFLISEDEYNNILNERYYNNVKELNEIDECMARIKEKVGNKYGKELVVEDINISKENKIIENNLKKLFNFEEVYIFWETSASVNGYTMPIIYSAPFIDWTTTEDIKKGVSYKNSKGKKVNIHLFYSIFTVADLSPREATAVLLHEVGHNFYYHKMSILTSEFFYVLITLLQPFEMIKIFLKNKMDKVDRENFNGIINNASNKIKTPLEFYKDILYQLKLYCFFPLVNPISIIIYNINKIFPNLVFNNILLDKYRNEKFADNFATMYGYGVETASLQNKFSKPCELSAGNKVFFSRIPLIDIYARNIYEYLKAISDLSFNEHPKSITRIKEQKKYLEHCLNETKLTSKQKTEIRKQISEIDKIYESYYDITEGAPELRALMNPIREKFGIPEDDIREFIGFKSDYDYKYIYDK